MDQHKNHSGKPGSGKPGDRSGKKFEHRDGKPFGEKKYEHRDGKPFGEKKYEHRGDKPFGEKKYDHRDGKPFGEKKYDHRDGKPFGEKKYDHRDGKPFGEKKFEHRDGKPFGEKKFGHRDGKPFGEKKFGHRDGKPFGEKKFEHRGDKPFGEKKFEHRDGKPFAEKKPAGRAPYVGARDVALRALTNVVRENAYAAQALDRELNAARLSDEDRRLAASLFYTALENRLRIDGQIARLTTTRPDPETVEILHIAAAQILFMDRIPDHAAVDEAVEQTRRANREGMTALVNGVLRNLIRARDAGGLELPDRDADPEGYISERYSVAPELVRRLCSAYGTSGTEEIVSWTPDRHTQAVRANHMRMRDDEFEAWLSNNGFTYEKSIVPGAYLLKDAGRIASHEGYFKGMFSIQGESSMLAAQAVAARGGMQILDVCAAPGGKSCYIAEAMGGSGRVYAWDLHEHRVELIRAAAARLGLENIRPQVRDAQKPNENLFGQMDVVLVDAPCSGLGVMGDKPDIKYRLTGDTIDALVPIQAKILDTCAHYVRAGGLLVYSTCTLLPEENERQVRAFLEAHPEFFPEADVSYLPETLRPYAKDGMIQILPGRDHLEGFFIARLRRRADSYE